MQKYIGVKLVDAEPMTRGEYNRERNWIIPINENPDDPGYFVRYQNGHITWCPKETFEKQNFLLNDPDNNTVTQEDVDAFIKQIRATEVTPNDIGTRVTVVTATLANGFTITESSTCVDPKNYDVEICIDCCIERIADKVWTLLAFLLSCGVNGFQKVGK